MPSSQHRRVLNVNQKQAEFYDHFDGESRLNLPSRWWARFRRSVKGRLNVTERVNELQQRIIRDVAPTDVLEIGCYEGRPMSLWLINDASLRRYVGIELSGKALERFRAKIGETPRCEVSLIQQDFLANDLPAESFDLVYMNGVLHHFPDLPGVCHHLARVLKPGGRLVTFDPMITNPLFRTARALYRPFQSDAQWEWPLRRSSFNVLQQHFEIERLHGLLGWEMYAALLHAAVPLRWTASLVARAQQRDGRRATGLSRDLYRCNMVVMSLRKRS